MKPAIVWLGLILSGCSVDPEPEPAKVPPANDEVAEAKCLDVVARCAEAATSCSEYCRTVCDTDPSCVKAVCETNCENGDILCQHDVSACQAAP